MVRLQAAVMSYADVFLMMTVLFLALAAFGLLMKRPNGGCRRRTLKSDRNDDVPHRHCRT